MSLYPTHIKLCLAMYTGINALLGAGIGYYYDVRIQSPHKDVIRHSTLWHQLKPRLHSAFVGSIIGPFPLYLLYAYGNSPTTLKLFK